MLEFLRSTPAQAVIWVTALIVLCLIGVFIVKWLRERMNRDEGSASEWLSEFRQMREGGDITIQEFQQIKGVLGTKLQQSLEAKNTESDE